MSARSRRPWRRRRPRRRLKDDLRRERDLRAFYVQEIKTIKADGQGRGDPQAAGTGGRGQPLQDRAADRGGSRWRAAQQLQEIALKPIDAGIDRAAETETLKDDVKQANRKVRFWQTQVRILKELVKQRKATG